MKDRHTGRHRGRLYFRLIRLVSLIVPGRFRDEWKREWEAELLYRESLLREWRQLNLLTRLELLQRSLGSFRDALVLQPQRLEDEMFQDLRYGFRLLIKNPGFTLIAVITLSLGIGANTAIFSVVNGVLLKPLPYPEPERLVRVFETSRNFPKFPMSPGNFRDYRDQNTVFESFAVYTRNDLELSLGDKPERLAALIVSSGFFRALGFEPLLGREFNRDEELPGTRVVVLSHSLWQRRFGGDPDIVGKKITLSGNPFTVVGVMPAGVQHVGGDYRTLPHGESVDVWWPMGLEAKSPRFAHFLNTIGRLKPGVTREQADAEFNAIAGRLAEQYPDTNEAWRIRTVALHEEIVGRTRATLLVLLGAVFFVLLIACVNVANLMLVRATAREREVAVRSALGAGRARLIRQMLTESLLVAALGGLSGLLLARLAISALIRLGPEQLPRLQMISIDGRILAFTLATSLLTGLLFGMAPAFQSMKLSLNELLKEGGRAMSGGTRQRRLRDALVITEVALALVLLVGAGLLLRSFLKLQQTDPGFRPEGVMTMSLSLPRARYSEPDKIVAFYDRLIERVSALPGVQSVGLTSDLPWTGYDENAGFSIEGKTFPPGQDPHGRYHFASPDYFRTIGVPLVAGRWVNSGDVRKAPQVVLINQSMARRYWPEGNAVGGRITFSDKPKGEDWMTVVGVTSDVKDYPTSAEAEPAFYWPLAQQPNGEMILAIRTSVDPFTLVEAVRSQTRSLDKDLPLADVRTLEAIATAATGGQRFTLLLVSLFAATALALAAVGIYGVMSYLVTQRTHEIGIRMALGAGTVDVLGLVLRQGMRLAAAGVATGLAAAFALTRLMESLLFGVRPTDPVTFIGIPLVLAGVALVACYFPARRAMKTDPMVALRYE
ncbi:MAG TPA: ABC transporter permease [Blastocatellia bacterium]|nr:ABC transporter permease [Blastocatellia bacterium]